MFPDLVLFTAVHCSECSLYQWAEIVVSEVSANSRNNVAGNEPPEGPISCPSWVSVPYIMDSQPIIGG
ncbi:hypothetical protein CDAR_471251 [Caerostris darwini]|uniref:Uncharacterized protein n=1 Tax=Caerostris darwini TaxID=1538125 RepID=A0AAV4QJK1_9ARAC|nr:hypothetical protein CDAR_471251 [Caerostris darwini]